ncbi:MAG: tetratricopeptide repeat protein [Chloroflexi bacterium]|nr:tetratricopeptide repeat protein [Chloroflexota bacterium]
MLEQCLPIFRDANDSTNESKVLTALADVWDERGDTAQAADLQRQALAVCNRLPNPSDRAISHLLRSPPDRVIPMLLRTC